MSRMLRPRHERRPLRLHTAFLGPWRAWEACLKARLMLTATDASLELASLRHVFGKEAREPSAPQCTPEGC